jgi:catechol 2,3-dioxygenase-like lactoylglutathione lyase family enzyme
MFNAISHSGIYVVDQDQALDFYVGKLGMEVESDVDLGFMRWLTVRVPGDDRVVLLEKPGPPFLADETAEKVRDLLTQGALGLAFILTTDDCHKTFDELEAKGVDAIQEPTEQPYGIDCAIRDPFGNHIRISQPAAVVGEITDDVKQRWEGTG